MQKFDQIELKIEKLSFGGAGVARHDGMVIFVSDSAPGDIVVAELTKVKKRFAEARTIKVLSPGNERREAPCLIAKECGGCQWQHITYNEQLIQKKIILQEQISKSEVLKNYVVSDIIHGDEFRYRNRIQVRALKNQIGFFKKKSNSIIPTKDCLITEESITNEFQNILSKNDNSRMKKYEIYRAMNDEVKIISDRNHGAEDGFSQVNEKMNLEMQKWVLTKVKDIDPDIFLDMYAGNGNFARYLSNNGIDCDLTAVEFSKSACALGKELDKQSKIKWITGKVEDELPKIELSNNNLVLIDPPRIGCAPEVLNSLAKAPISDLLYISCNPSTFVRDVNLLSEKRNIELVDLHGLDMFPQTYHIELMAHFKLKN